MKKKLEEISLTGKRIKVRCNGCGETKIIPDDFYYSRTHKRHMSPCKECRRSKYIPTPKKEGRKPYVPLRPAASRAIATKNREAVNKLRQVPCADCKNTYPTCCMDFDHRDPTKKKFNVCAYINRVTMLELMSEIRKCDVVCSNCHRIRTHITRRKIADNM